ncbi:MAG TPA: hypothetical protein VFC51_15110 [Chloroflexota bacterium]|nr:hypothetical protein [Chloroflexota bacterium]
MELRSDDPAEAVPVRGDRTTELTTGGAALVADPIAALAGLDGLDAPRAVRSRAVPPMEAALIGLAPVTVLTTDETGRVTLATLVAAPADGSDCPWSGVVAPALGPGTADGPDEPAALSPPVDDDWWSGVVAPAPGPGATDGLDTRAVALCTSRPALFASNSVAFAAPPRGPGCGAFGGAPVGPAPVAAWLAALAALPAWEPPFDAPLAMWLAVLATLLVALVTPPADWLAPLAAPVTARVAVLRAPPVPDPDVPAADATDGIAIPIKASRAETRSVCSGRWRIRLDNSSIPNGIRQKQKRSSFTPQPLAGRSLLPSSGWNLCQSPVRG